MTNVKLNSLVYAIKESYIDILLYMFIKKFQEINYIIF